MANELSTQAIRNKTGYFKARVQGTGFTIIPGSPSTFEQEVVAHWASYAIAATESDHPNGGTGLYQANMPAGVPAGIVVYDFFLQAGDSPSIITDTLAAPGGWINWNGTADVISNGMGIILAANGLDGISIAGKTLPNAIKYIGAAVAGECSGAGTGIETYSDFSDATAFVVTIDTNGNRTGIAYS